MKNQTFGIEIETTGLGCEHTAKAIAAHFGTTARYVGRHLGDWHIPIQVLVAHDTVYGAGLSGIEITPQHVRISGFGEAPDVRTLKAYGQLAVLMATRSRELRYVYARHFTVTNELFTFRAWLVTLGMNGREFKETAKF